MVRVVFKDRSILRKETGGHLSLLERDVAAW